MPPPPKGRLAFAVALALVLLPASLLAAPPAAPAPRTDKDDVAARLDRQDEELARLRRELAEERAARAAQERRLDETVRRLPDLPAQTVLRAGRFGLTLTGFVHADAILHSSLSEDEINPLTGDLLNETRFFIRRSRLRAELGYGILGGALEFDGNTVSGLTARIIAGEISLRWPAPPQQVPYVSATLGLFKIPFGFEVLQSDRDRLFLERASVVRAMFPGEYDLGARLSGGYRILRYAVALMNGAPAADKQFSARDPTQQKDVVARLGLDGQLPRGVRLAGGASFDYGSGLHRGQVQTATAPAVPSQTYERWGVGADLQAQAELPVLGPLTIYGEFIYAINLDRGLVVSDPIARGRDLRGLGFYVALTQELTRWAAAGLRYDRYAPDLDEPEVMADGAPAPNLYATLAAALSFRYRPHGRFVLEYEHLQHMPPRILPGLQTRTGGHVLGLRGEIAF